MSVYVANESDAEVDELALSRLARFVLDTMGVDPLAELSIMLVDHAEMERLHLAYMGEPGPTDVLAFPQDELSSAAAHDPVDDEAPETLLGDVVLCPSVAETQAKQAGHATADELHLLTTHGILHLLGYDHAEPEEEREMFGKQAELLAAWRTATAAGSGGPADGATGA
ncbi:MAG: metalloprotease ybeY [Mycobacterium sp.]|nr:metalloprotease ybeY [Mycobacterium sp.]MCW2745826.1 metalloprotease ybeY [Mycobacterium sp.]